MIKFIFNCELGHINLKHPDFVGRYGAFAGLANLIEQERRIRQNS
jgi:hypothetical protein